MRLLLAALLTLAGCSGPAPVDEGPAPWRYTRDSAIEGEDAAETPADTAPAPVDSSEVGQPDVTPDTYTPPDTAPPPDTHVCAPADPVKVCVSTVPVTAPCGLRPDGCGGLIPCAECAANRRCVTSATSLGHCACSPVVGKLCQTLSDVTGQMWECPAGVTPTNADAKFYPQPKASISWWCSSKGG